MVGDLEDFHRNVDASWLPMVSFLATPEERFLVYIDKNMCIYIYTWNCKKKFGESLIDDELQKVWTVAASLSYCMFEVNF